jgi:transmembrane sensor
MEDDRIWILFARRISGEITPEELKELDALIREQPDRGFSMEIILRLFESERKVDERVDAEMKRRLWSRIEAAIDKAE